MLVTVSHHSCKTLCRLNPIFVFNPIFENRSLYVTKFYNNVPIIDSGVSFERRGAPALPNFRSMSLIENRRDCSPKYLLDGVCSAEGVFARMIIVVFLWTVFFRVSY